MGTSVGYEVKWVGVGHVKELRGRVEDGSTLSVSCNLSLQVASWHLLLPVFLVFPRQNASMFVCVCVCLSSVATYVKPNNVLLKNNIIKKYIYIYKAKQQKNCHKSIKKNCWKMLIKILFFSLSLFAVFHLRFGSAFLCVAPHS